MKDIIDEFSHLSPAKRKLLEQLLREKIAQKPGVSSQGISRHGQQEKAPLSFAQQQLWLLDQIEPGNSAYNLSTVFRIMGPLDLESLERSLQEIVRRHDVLRTTLVSQEGQPVQIIAPALNLRLSTVNLGQLPEREREKELIHLASEEAHLSFNLAQGPLLRAVLLQLKNAEHALLVVFHHAIFDAWSANIFIHELTTLYGAFSSAKPSSLAELPIQYADFAAWQRDWLQGEVLADHLRYWQKRLEGAPAYLNLPTDRVRPAILSSRGAHYAFQLPAVLSKELKTLSQRESSTLFMILLAAFQALLSRYTGQEDIVIGTNSANRNQAETEKLIGLFVNMLVIRTDLSGNPTFLELLHRVRDVVLEAFTYQDMPFERLVAAIQPERHLSHSPIFQILFTLQNVSVANHSLAAHTTLLHLPSESGASKFDLTLEMSEADQGLSGTVEYNTDLFDRSTIIRMLDHFRTLLENLVTDPEQRLANLALLTAEEYTQQVQVWNATRVDFAEDLCIHELIERCVEKSPEAIAVTFADKQLSYQELNLRANQLAYHLQACGVQPGTLIGVCLERSEMVLVTLLAILKVGGAYLPIDPTYPQERLAFMLEDSQAPVLITQPWLTYKFPILALQVIYLALEGPIRNTPYLQNPAGKVSSEQVAYVIYTSGSTGHPKGTAIPHRAVTNFFASMCQQPGISRQDVVLAITSLSFDIAVLELLLPLTVGARVHLVSQEESSNGKDLAARLLLSGATVMQATPATWHLLLAEGWNGGAHVMMLCGGEALLLELATLLQPKGEQLWNMYGPTETTIWSAVGLINGREERISIGRAIANTQIYLLDRNLQPVPIGVTGELYIGGKGLAHGYLYRPELSAEKFIPNPFSVEAGSRMYRTGDLACYLPDGTIECLGRMDKQVKIRGFRIELGEVESALAQYSTVHGCAVIVHADAPTNQYLVAYFVSKQEVPPSSTELRRYLKGKVPDYMVPARFIHLQALPLTPNGKTDRNRLPFPQLSEERMQQDAPFDEIVELLLGIWSQALGVDHIDLHANFFEMGGHSLLATQVISSIRTILHVELSVRSIFETPTLAELALRIKQEMAKEHALYAIPIMPVSRQDHLPLSFAQQRLWFLEQLEPGSATYTISFSISMQGMLDLNILEHCLSTIVQRHESLRTTFRSVEDQVVQVIANAISCNFQHWDLRGLSEEERKIEARKLAEKEALQPFDLVYGPLWQLSILHLDTQQHVLLLAMHHIISDHWSINLLMRELTILYNAFVEGQPSPLPALPLQYADFAVWQRQWLQGAVLEADLAYWQEQLRGIVPLDLPTDHARPALQSSHGSGQTLVLPVSLLVDLQRMSQREGVTLFMTLLAAFQVLLARYSGQDDIVVGSPIANRTRQEIEGLIGFFVNTLVLRTNLAGNPSFVDLLQRVREVALGAYTHQYVPFEKVVESVQQERDLSRSPLFQVMLSLQESFLPTQGWKDITFDQLDYDRGTAKFDLNLMLIELPQGLECIAEYNTDLFESATIQRLLQHWQTLLEGIVTDPAQTLADLPILSSRERHHLLIDLNQAQADFPLQRSFSQLFEQQVQRAPQAIALVDKQISWSYQQLDRQANQLAHYLRLQGITTECLVGLYLERSADLLIAILATFKAGGAYVPLDPAYPQQRLHSILQEAQPRIVLTHTSLQADLAHVGGALFCLDTGDVSTYPADTPPVSRQSEHQLAYVIYTSGSTGRPKGAMLSQSGMLNHQFAKITTLALSQQDKVAQTASACFDISVWQLLAVLLCGGQVFILPDEIAQDPAALLKHILQEQLTIVEVVPALLRVLLDYLEQERQELVALRWLIATGEALPSELSLRWLRVSGQLPLLNAYGPTECSDDVTHALVHTLPSTDRPSASIGRPIVNMQLYVLDSQGQPVPFGVVGEIYVGGVGVGRGYLDDPERTAQVFGPDPFGQQAGGRLYRTGDKARYLPDATLEFLGRVDQQVKVRGYRIELGEIEAVLAQYPEVHESLVLVREDSPGNQRLVAYVVHSSARQAMVAQAGSQYDDDPLPNNSADTVIPQLRSFLREKLPHYMLPSAFVILSALPLTANGKIDRRQLPAPVEEQGAAEESRSGPQSAIEEIVLGIWQQVLQQDRIGLHDNFFKSGGHSLLAMQVVARIQKVLRVELPLRRFFEAPTVAALASFIEQEMQVVAEQEIAPLLPISREQPMPLSFAQQRLWFLDQLESGSVAYNISSGVLLKGPLNCIALEYAIHEIVRRQESLRTTLHTVEGKGVQRINPSGVFQLPRVYLSTLSANEQYGEVRRLLRAESLQPFNLIQGPLFRTQLLYLNEHEHVLLLTMHHIISDGWSLGVFIRELTILYNAFAQGQPSPLPALPLQYADFAVWQRQWLQGAVLEADLAYWQEQLHGIVPLDLPIDHARPALQSSHGSGQTLVLPASLLVDLQRMSQREGVTLFMTLLAAFQVLLARYSGQDDIVVGSPIANRTRQEIEGLIGFFVNTLVLRTSLAGNPSFVDLLQRVREVALGAYTHQYVPFEKIVESVQQERDLSRSSLFQVMFVLQNASLDAGEWIDVTLHPLAYESTTAKFDLNFMLTETAEGLECIAEYNSDLFEASTIHRLLQHWHTLLENIAEDPRQRLAHLAILTADERQLLLRDWNQTQTDYPLNYLFHHHFVQQVARTPHAIAMVVGYDWFTYEILNLRSNQLAHYLRQLGVGPDLLVGLYMHRCADLLIAILAIFKAGGAYLPLDPNYPQQRQLTILQEAQPCVILTASSLQDSLPATPAVVICTDVAWAALASLPDSMPSAMDATGQQLAYVIYTSGSTGRPKGVMVNQQGMLNHLFAKVETLQLNHQDQVAQTASVCFDVSVWQLLAALLCGAQVHILPDEIAHDPGALSRQLSQANLTILEIVPSYLRALLDFLEQTKQEPVPELVLRWLLITGEAFPAELGRRWQQIYPYISLLNAYGPTECSDDVTHALVTTPLAREHASVPIGRPVANTQIYILDEGGQPAPVGVPGEIYVGGIGVGRGYLHDAARTAQLFVPDPFGTRSGARLYRTGDQARYLSDGQIKFLGRVDQQVKVRGFRIELGEIEDVLIQHPALKDCAVIVNNEHDGVKRLVAYVVADQQAMPGVNELRHYLQEKLPEYMLPALFVPMEALPLSPNGKLDLRALPDPGGLRLEVKDSFVAPRTPIEEVLVGIWTDVLSVQQVGTHDNFFSLGGDSILSIQIISRANQAGLRLTLKQLFQHQTIEELSTVVDVSPIIQAEQGSVVGLVPLTPIQHWFFSQAFSEPHYWNQSILLEGPHPLNAVYLEQCLAMLLTHHDALRLRFSQREEGWQQAIVAPGEAVPFISIDLSSLKSDRQDMAVAMLEADLQASLNIVEGPLLRSICLNRGSLRKPLLLIIIHHLAIDSVSWRIVSEDLQSIYQQLSQKESAQLPPKTTSFKRWAEHLLEYAQLKRAEHSQSYWLAEARKGVVRLPLDYPDNENLNTVGSAQVVALSLPAEETRALLEDVPRAYNTQINEALLTALALAITQWTGSSSLLIDLEGHGREDLFEGVDVSRTVGWFTSLTPVLLQIEETALLGDVFKAVKEQLRHIPNRGIDYGILRYLTSPSVLVEELKSLPQPEIVFNYHGQFDGSTRSSAVFRPVDQYLGVPASPRDKRTYLLEINCSVTNGQLQIDWYYSQHNHLRSTIERLADVFIETLCALIRHCKASAGGGYTPSDFPLVELNQEQLEQLLAQIDLG